MRVTRGLAAAASQEIAVVEAEAPAHKNTPFMRAMAMQSSGESCFLPPAFAL